MAAYSFRVTGVDLPIDRTEYDFPDDRAAVSEAVRLLNEIIHDDPPGMVALSLQVRVRRDGDTVGILNFSCTMS